MNVHVPGQDVNVRACPILPSRDLRLTSFLAVVHLVCFDYRGPRCVRCDRRLFYVQIHGQAIDLTFLTSIASPTRRCGFASLCRFFVRLASHGPDPTGGLSI
jgi:hypothetical protein